MNILITGAAGFVGHHIAKYLLEHTSHRIIPIDLIPVDSPVIGEIKSLDIQDRDEVEDLFRNDQVDAVLHFAGLVNRLESYNNPLRFYGTNVASFVSILDLCIKYGVYKFVFPSSAAVYGNNRIGKLKESDLCDPASPYAWTKLMCEQILNHTAQAHTEFRHVTLRLFFVLATTSLAYLDIGQANAYPNVMRIIAQAALGIRDKFVIYGDQFDTYDGTAVCDFISIDDVGTMVVQSLDYLENGNYSQVFNCGSGQGYSIRELVTTMKRITGHPFPVYVQDPSLEQRDILVADISNSEGMLNWHPIEYDVESLCYKALEFEKMLLDTN